MELKLFATKASHRWVHWDDIDENLGLKTALRIFVVLYFSETLMLANNFNKSSVGTEQAFLAPLNALELKKMAWQQFQLATDTKNRFDESLWLS